MKFDYGTVIFCSRKLADRLLLKIQEHEMLFTPLNGVPRDTYWWRLENPVGYRKSLQLPLHKLHGSLSVSPWQLYGFVL